MADFALDVVLCIHIYAAILLVVITFKAHPPSAFLPWFRVARCIALNEVGESILWFFCDRFPDSVCPIAAEANLALYHSSLFLWLLASVVILVTVRDCMFARSPRSLPRSYSRYLLHLRRHPHRTFLADRTHIVFDGNLQCIITIAPGAVATVSFLFLRTKGMFNTTCWFDVSAPDSIRAAKLLFYYPSYFVLLAQVALAFGSFWAISVGQRRLRATETAPSPLQPISVSSGYLGKVGAARADSDIETAMPPSAAALALAAVAAAAESPELKAPTPATHGNGFFTLPFGSGTSKSGTVTRSHTSDYSDSAYSSGVAPSLGSDLSQTSTATILASASLKQASSVASRARRRLWRKEHMRMQQVVLRSVLSRAWLAPLVSAFVISASLLNDFYGASIFADRPVLHIFVYLLCTDGVLAFITLGIPIMGTRKRLAAPAVVCTQTV
jgi:hypothetical protein